MRAEQSRAEQSRAEQSRAEQSRAEQSRAEQSRAEQYDVLKGMAILLVVIGHCIQFGSGANFIEQESFYDNIVFKVIYSFHMPLFISISGFLTAYSVKKKSCLLFLKSKFRSILIPLLSWGMINFAIDVIINGARSGLLGIIKQYVLAQVATLWFLWALLFCSIAFTIVHYFGKDNIVFHIIIIVFSLFLTDSFNLGYFKYLYPYFVFGYMTNRYALLNRWREWKNRYLFWAFVLPLYCVLLVFFKNDIYIYRTGVTLLHSEIGMLYQLFIDVYRWLIGVIGTASFVLVFEIAKSKIGEKIWMLLIYLGQSSLGIYILNSYTNKYLLCVLTENFLPNVFIWILETAVSMIIYVAIVEIIKKIPAANKLLLGGR